MPAIAAEIDRLEQGLVRPVARIGEESLDVLGVERALRRAIVVDGLRRRVHARADVDLSRRPVLFALLAALAGAHPNPPDGTAPIAAAFAASRPNESPRARLRVEPGRLRALLPRPLRLVAGPGGWRLETGGAKIALIEPLAPAAQAALEALLADGAAWPAAELA